MYTWHSSFIPSAYTENSQAKIHISSIIMDADPGSYPSQKKSLRNLDKSPAAWHSASGSAHHVCHRSGRDRTPSLAGFDVVWSVSATAVLGR